MRPPQRSCCLYQFESSCSAESKIGVEIHLAGNAFCISLLNASFHTSSGSATSQTYRASGSLNPTRIKSCRSFGTGRLHLTNWVAQVGNAVARDYLRVAENG